MALFTVDQEKCVKCGACAAECPTRIVAMADKDSYPEPYGPLVEFCLFCGHCVAVCPSGALSLSTISPADCRTLDKELAVSPQQARQFLAGRRSIRTFKKEPLTKEELAELVRVASEAASAKNVQPWRFMVIEKRETVKEMAGLVVDWMKGLLKQFPGDETVKPYLRVVAGWRMGYDVVTRGAPHLVVVHADQNWHYASQDCTLALAHLDLYAAAAGLGACWAGYFQRAANEHPPLRQALGMPEGQACFGAMMLGRPKYKYHRLPKRNQPVIAWK